MANIKELRNEIESRKPSVQKNMSRAHSLALRGLAMVMPTVPKEEQQYHQINISRLDSYIVKIKD